MSYFYFQYTFFILRLSYPQVFQFEDLASKAIKTMEVGELEDYSEGWFQTFFTGFHVFEFSKTLQASSALWGDFKVAIKDENIDVTLPQREVVQISVDIICIPRRHVDKGVQEGKQEGIREAIETLRAPITNKLEAYVSSSCCSHWCCYAMRVWSWWEQ